MSNRWYWAGQVQNCSPIWLWCLFDEEGEVVAKILKPGRSSPGWTDVDAVKPYLAGKAISRHRSWWQLKGGAEATVLNNIRGCSETEALKIEQTSWIGDLVRTEEIDWGTIHYDHDDQEWGA